MAISGTGARDQIITGLTGAPDVTEVTKTTAAATVLGQRRSLWAAAGNPVAGSAPTAAAVPTEATAGALFLVDQTAPVSSYLGRFFPVSPNAAGSAFIRDRLAHQGGLVGNVATAQTTNLPINLATLGVASARLGAANYREVQWFLEWYTATGSTAVTATIAVTYDDDSTGTVTAAVPANAAAGAMVPFFSAVAGRFIKAVTQVTLSATTGTAGNFGITATRLRGDFPFGVAGQGVLYDWAQTGMAEIANDSCLMIDILTTAAVAAVLNGSVRIIHG